MADNINSRSHRRRLFDGLAIVVSILLAFSIDAGWDEMQERREERDILAGVQRDFVSNQTQLSQAIASHRQRAQIYSWFRSSSPDEVRGVSADSANLIYTLLWAPRTFDPARSSIDALIGADSRAATETLNAICHRAAAVGRMRRGEAQPQVLEISDRSNGWPVTGKLNSQACLEGIMILRTSLIVTLTAGLSSPLFAQAIDRRPPVIDVHKHAPMRAGPVEDFLPSLRAWLAELDSMDVRLAVVNGVPDALFAWHEAAGDRAIPSLLFPCENGVAVNWGRPCFEDGADWPDIDQLRAYIEAGQVRALGEITTQYLGLSPSDPALEPYFALAEEYDLPVFIHMGPGPMFSAYEENEFLLDAPNYRAVMGNPLLLEEALLKHPTVRVAVMHSGWPLADEMVFLLYQHPQVYAEVGLLQYTPYFPRVEYYSFLRRLVEAGFGDRVLFGSDASLEEGIEAIVDADFLTRQQKEDILCNNAARFLRLNESICR